MKVNFMKQSFILMSKNTRNIWLFSLFAVFYFSYWYWRLSDFYSPPFYSEESPLELNTISGISNTSLNLPVDFKAKSFIDKFQDINQGEENGTLEWEENINNLAALDHLAIPVIFEYLNSSIDANFKQILLQVLEKIDDPLVRKDLEALLSVNDTNAQLSVIHTLLQLKCVESIPNLEELLTKTNDEDLKSAIENALFDLKCLLINRGDFTEIFKLLPIQFSETKNFDNTIKMLCMYLPLQRALNCHEGMFLNEKNKILFLKAVDEWYYEQVLMKASPYKVPIDFKFQEPFAYEKQKAWDLLCAESNKNDKFSVIRVLPIEKDLTETDLQRELTVITGYGHGGGLTVYNFKPNGAKVVIQSFGLRYGKKRSEFGEDFGETSYKVSELSISEYKSCLAALHIIFSATIFEWWNGSGNTGSYGSTNNFAISFTGFENGSATTNAFCGYPRSAARIKYTKLVVANKLVYDLVNSKNLELLNEQPDSSLFSKIFLMTKEKWFSEEWWWVGDRMLSLAYDFGDKSILASLSFFFKEDAESDQSKFQHLAYRAVNAMAQITKNDFRFEKDGSPKPIKIVAKEYLDYLEERPK